MNLHMIAALDERWGIGKDGSIPWDCPADRAMFREATQGSAIIMGRKTWDSLPRKPLPKRHNIVLTTASVCAAPCGSGPPACAWVNTAEQALEEARWWLQVTKDDPVFPWKGRPEPPTYVIGGAEIYRLFLPWANTLHLSWMPGEHSCDTFFPAFPLHEWERYLNALHWGGDPGFMYEIWTRRGQP